MKRPHNATPATPNPEPKPEPSTKQPLNIELAPEPEPTIVALSELDPERYVTARVKRTDPIAVVTYAERMVEGDAFPPVELFRDETGALWLGDGVHRVEAARKNGFTTIAARVSEGGRLAALRHAAGANESHGLRRTNEDKRRAVTMLLDDPEMAQLSDRQLAELARVSHPLVAEVKASTGKTTSGPTIGKDGKVRGKKEEEQAPGRNPREGCPRGEQKPREGHQGVAVQRFPRPASHRGPGVARPSRIVPPVGADRWRCVVTLARDYLRLPEPFRSELAGYLENRKPPREFMLALLSNDLRGALTLGNQEDRDALSSLVSWLYKCAPRFSWGSVALVDAWLRGQDERGLVRG